MSSTKPTKKCDWILKRFNQLTKKTIPEIKENEKELIMDLCRFCLNFSRGEETNKIIKSLYEICDSLENLNSSTEEEENSYRMIYMFVLGIMFLLALYGLFKLFREDD